MAKKPRNEVRIPIILDGELDSWLIGRKDENKYFWKVLAPDLPPPRDEIIKERAIDPDSPESRREAAEILLDEFEADGLTEKAAEGLINALCEQLLELKDDKDGQCVELGDGEEVVLTDNGVLLRKLRRNKRGGELEVSGMRKVVVGRFRPLRKLELDGESIFEVETTRKFRGNAEEVLAQLKREGIIVHKARASDAINALLSGLELPVERGHATFGVYKTESGELELCLEPQPRSESQARIKKQIGKKVHTEATPGNLAAWFRLREFWHPYELYPVMALAAIAPFALVLKDEGVPVPYLYHLSQESGLGKTELLRLFTRRLFGNEILSTDAIKSDYRLADTLDSFGGLIAIEEAENFAWEKFSPHLQLSAEQPLQDARGTGSLGSRPYWSRAVLGFSGNHFPTKRKALLVRFITVEFDRTALKERRRLENRRRLKNITRRLKPIGWRIVEAEIEAIKTAEELVRRIEKHEERIEETYPGSFEDPRRAGIWAVVYEGLQAWQRLAEQLGVDWRAPSYEGFVNDVVAMIETNAFAQVEAPVAQFITWWRGWKATHEDGMGNIKGQDKIWREHVIETGEKKVQGDVITRAVLDIYERESRHKGSVAVLTLTDLNKGVEALYNIPLDKLPSSARIGGRKYKVAFIPADDPTEEGEEKNNETPQKPKFQGSTHQKPGPEGWNLGENAKVPLSTGTGKAGGTPEPAKSGGAQKNNAAPREVLKAIMAYVREHEPCISEDVAAALVKQGVEEDRTLWYVEALIKSGHLIRDARGRLLLGGGSA